MAIVKRNLFIKKIKKNLMKTKNFFSISMVILSLGLSLTSCEKSDNTNPFEVNLTSSSTLGNYLTDKDGNTLYFFALDANGLNNCTGGCTTAWPIFTVSALTQEKLGSGLVLSDFGTINSGSGNQVTYKGWPLYYYSPGGVREKANITSGEGVNGLWFVAKPDYTVMLASAQLVGADAKNYVVSATNVYSEGTGKTTYFTDLVGRTLYAYYKDSLNLNKYTKADLSNNGVWPIYETDKIVVPSILDKSLFSSITIYGKKQLTYKGWPMYYYGSDADAAGVFRGNNKGVSVPKPNIWPVFMKDYPTAPKK
jgi:predicted lipoprotein with Yx(FWY)xxD motif